MNGALNQTSNLLQSILSLLALNNLLNLHVAPKLSPVGLGVGVNLTTKNDFCSTPLNFPPSLQLYSQHYQNWNGEIELNGIWIVIPKSTSEIITLSNWASKSGYKLRALGYNRNWSPLLVTSRSSCHKLLLVDTKQHFKSMEMVSTSPPTVRVQTGASMQQLLDFLEIQGFTINVIPAPGDISIGGVIAIGAHGTGVPIAGEKSELGKSYGSLSNLVVDLKAIVWNSNLEAFELRTFQRNEAETPAFLTNLGRTFLIEITLRVTRAFNLQCVSITDIPMEELTRHPNKVTSSTRTISKFLDSHGRTEMIIWPFTSAPWLKLWRESPEKPRNATEVSSPYNYPFADNIPSLIENVVTAIMIGTWELTPVYGFLQFEIIKSGLLLSSGYNLWGSSKNLLLYVQHTTLHVKEAGFAILTKRSNVQLVVHRLYNFYLKLVNDYRNKHLYPVNCPVDIRVSGLDTLEYGPSPALSPLQPDNDHPEFNSVVWMNILSFPGTPHFNSFMATFEKFVYLQLPREMNGSITVRPEWAKGWAFTDESAWSNKELLHKVFPRTFKENWNFTVNVLNKYDPRKVFSNEFLDEFMQ